MIRNGRVEQVATENNVQNKRDQAKTVLRFLLEENRNWMYSDNEVNRIRKVEHCIKKGISLRKDPEALAIWREETFVLLSEKGCETSENVPLKNTVNKGRPLGSTK